MFYYHTLHMLIKVLFFRFLPLQLLNLYFLYFFYTSSNTMTLFLYTKLVKFSNVWFLFISLYSLHTLFIKTNSSWQIVESIKHLKIKTSILFNFDFTNNTFLPCFFFFILIIDLHFLVRAVIAQIFNPIAELIFPTRIPIR